MSAVAAQKIPATLATARDAAVEVRGLAKVYDGGVEALRETFRSNTIADIARRDAQEADAGMYYI